MTTPEGPTARKAGTGSPPFDPEKAGKVGQAVEILGIELLRAHFDRKDQTALQTSGEPPSTVPSFALNVEWARSADGTKLGCAITFGTDFGTAEGPYSLTALFRLTYSIAAAVAISDDDIDNFVHWNAVFNAWPYWREYLSSTINRAGLPRFAAPVMKLPLAGAATPTR